MSSLSRAAQRNESTFKLISHVLVAMMITCAAYTVLSLIDRLFPDWHPHYLPVLCFLTAVERLLTYQRFKQLTQLSREWASALLSEWVIILLIAKLVTGLSHGVSVFLSTIPEWLTNFSGTFLTSEFVFIALLLFFTWLISGNFGELLSEIELTKAMQLEIDPGQEKGKPPARERLLSLVFSLGTGLVAITGLVRLDIRAFMADTNQLTFTDMPALAGGGASTLLYFMLGMALLSQTRFMDLHTRWSVQRIPVSARLGRGWALYSLGFLGLMTLLVAIMPTSYSLQTLSLLGDLLGFAASILFFIAQSILAFIIFLMGLVLLLAGRAPESPRVQKPIPELPNISAIGQAAPPPVWLEAAKTWLFWGIFLAVILFSLVQYMRQHKEMLVSVREFAARLRLGRAWHWLRNLFKQAQSSLSHIVQNGRERLRRAGLGKPGAGIFLSPHKLDARQKITFFYLAMLRRGGEKGLPRHNSQTPFEYASRLESALPEAKEDINALTDAFIEARYSPHTVEPEQVNLVKSTWERLRKSLRKP